MRPATARCDRGVRRTLDAEFDELVAEIDRIAQATEFDDHKLLDGSSGTLWLQVGMTTEEHSRIGVTFGDTRASALGLAALDFADSANVATAMQAPQLAQRLITGGR